MLTFLLLKKSRYRSWSFTFSVVVAPYLCECVNDHVAREDDVKLSKPNVLSFVCGHCLLKNKKCNNESDFFDMHVTSQVGSCDI